jgi:hypothetical protein
MILACALILPQPAQAASSFTQNDATNLASNCLGNWNSQGCLQVVSQSNLAMASEYGSALEQSGKKAAAESIKQHCAASTAATQGEFPAYAFKSAFTECANTMSDVFDQTQMAPDSNRFQVLLGAIWCMDGAQQCVNVENGLKPFIKQ